MADRASDLRIGFKVDPVKASDAFRDVHKHAAQLDKEMSEALNVTRKLGGKRAFKIETDTKELVGKLKEAEMELAHFKKALKNDEVKGDLREQLKNLHTISLAKVTDLNAQWAKEKKFTDKRKDLQEEAAKRLNGVMSHATQTFGEGLHDAFKDVTSKDVGSLAGLFGKLSKLNQMGAEKAKMAAQGREGTKGGAMLEGIGGFLTEIGPALAAIAAVAVGIAAVVKILMDADAQFKEFNKSVLDAGVAGADLGKTYKEVSTTLREVRGAAYDFFGFNVKWGATAKDMAQIVGEYNAAGFTLGEMRDQIKGATTDQEAYQKATESALIYSKLLGESTGEIAKLQSDYMEELGLSLSGIEDRFSGILSVARESGFGVKRFFSMITQATSGMTLYNIRLEEAVSLLVTMGKALGQTKGGEMVKSLTEGFKNMDPMELIKTMKLAGGKGVVNAMMRPDLAGQAGEFGKKVGDSKQSYALEALIKGKVKVGFDKPAEFAEALGKMPSKDRMALSSAVMAYDDGLGRMIASLGDFSEDLQKNTEEGTAAALRYAGAQTVLMLKTSAIRALPGGASFGKMGDDNLKLQKAALTALGISVEEFRNLRKAEQVYLGNQNQLQDEQKKIQEMEKKQVGSGAKEAEEFNKTFGKNLGVVLGTGEKDKGNLGQWYKAEYKPGGEGLDEVLTYSEKAMEETKDALMRLEKTPEEPGVEEDKDQALHIAEDTLSYQKIIEMGTESLLNKLIDVTSEIRDLISFGRGDLSEEQKWAKEAALSDIEAEISAADKKLIDTEKEKAELEKKMKAAPAEEKASFKAQIKEKEDLKKDLKRDKDSLRQQYRGVRGIERGTELGEGEGLTAEDFRIKGMGKVKLPPEVMENISRQVVSQKLEAYGGPAPRYDEGMKKAAAGAVLGSSFGPVGTAVGGGLGYLKGTQELSGEEQVKFQAKEDERLENKLKREADRERKRYDDSRLEHDAVIYAQKQADEIERRKKENIEAILQGAGIDSRMASAYATQLMSPVPQEKYRVNTLPVPDWTKKQLGTAEGVNKALLEDFIISKGMVQRISSQDDIVGFKGGGPVASALGGSQINHITLIGAGPRDLLNGLHNAVKAGVMHP
ncbi:MAG: hypothetical protein WC824_05745 [Bacteroidota bacterium]|jgi:hypothetical protein